MSGAGMHGTPAGRARAARRYHRLLGLLPADFRARNAAAMEEAFTGLHARAQCDGQWAVITLWIREFADLARTGLSLRLRAHATSRLETAGALRPSRRPSARLSLLGTLRDDWTLAVRATTRHRGFFLLASLTLAVGIGATTAMYSALKAVVLEPFPFPDADRMVTLHRLWGSGSGAQAWLGLGKEDIAALREAHDVFVGVEGWSTGAATLTGFDAPERIRSFRMTPGLASLIELRPALGRSFVAEDVAGAGQRVALISQAMWRTRLDGRSDVLGMQLRIDGEPWTIVGVLPRNAVPPTADPRHFDVWLPLPDRDPLRTTIARMADGVTPAMAVARVDAIVRRDPSHRGGGTVQPLMQPNPLHDHLRILMVAVTLLLVIACVNVSNLLLQRASVRSRETAVRAALGAGRSRLIRQFLLESTVLAAAGGIIGAGLSYLGLRMVLALRPERLTGLDRVRIDGDVLLFCMLASAVAGILFGVLPAVQGSRASATAALGRFGRDGDGASRFRWMLITAEVALSFALLVGAALTVAALRELSLRHPGYDADGLVALDVRLPAWRYADDHARVVALEGIVEGIRPLPTVESVSLADGVPPRVGGARFGRLHVEGRAPEPNPTFLHSFEVDPGFLQTLGVPVITGRNFADKDATTVGWHPVILSVSAARRLFGDENAVGRRFRQEGDTDYTVVGVVRDIRTSGLADEGTFPVAYWLRQQMRDRMVRDRMVIIVRSTAADPQFMLDLREIVRRSEPDAIVETETVREMLGASLAQERFTTSLLTTFATLAVLLAAVGLYGVLAQVVVSRTREIGVRIALGADAARIRRLVLRTGMSATLLGLALGAGLAGVGLRVLRGQVFGLTDAQPGIYVAAAGVLLAVALAAMLIPAARAARLDPMRAIRVE